METSDHVPCLVSFGTDIRQQHLFHFENYWLHHAQSMDLVSQSWSQPCPHTDPAKKIAAKFKHLRASLKQWQRQLSSLKGVIDNVKLLLSFLGIVEEYRDLSVEEWNFKSIIEEHLVSLLSQQKTYWKHRGHIKWVKSGDYATLKHRNSLISSIEYGDGSVY